MTKTCFKQKEPSKIIPDLRDQVHLKVSLSLLCKRLEKKVFSLHRKIEKFSKEELFEEFQNYDELCNEEVEQKAQEDIIFRQILGP